MNTHKDILSRREFFKSSAKKVIPIFGVVALGGLPFLSSCEKDPITNPSSCSDCSAICASSCQDSCTGNLTSSCSECATTCSSSCSTSCTSTCGGSSSGGCSECSSSCSASCENSSANNGNDPNDNEVSEASGIIDGYEYIDLGLSVKWARYNIGASSPEEYGTYHRFSSTSNSTSNLYDDLIAAGYFGGNKSVCGSKFDTATDEWGNNWQMPSKEHFEELIQSCKQEVVTYKNVKGILFTSNKNMNTIFFPYAGYYWRNSNYGWEECDLGTVGRYLSGFLRQCNAYIQDAMSICMSDSRIEEDYCEIYDFKFSIRPVASDGNNSDPNNCQNSCTINCANNSTGSGCSNCGANCSSNCGSNCSGACVNTCDTGCGKQCRYSCGGGCSQTCEGFCSDGCKGALKGDCSECTGSCYYLCSKSCSQYCYSSCTNMGVKSL